MKCKSAKILSDRPNITRNTILNLLLILLKKSKKKLLRLVQHAQYLVQPWPRCAVRGVVLVTIDAKHTSTHPLARRTSLASLSFKRFVLTKMDDTGEKLFRTKADYHPFTQERNTISGHHKKWNGRESINSGSIHINLHSHFSSRKTNKSRNQFEQRERFGPPGPPLWGILS